MTPLTLTTNRGRLTLALLCAVAFLDFVDASIVNIALPSIQRSLHVSVQGVQWVPSGYLLTYGGCMLLGGRAADLLGRRRVLLVGIATIGLASLAGGLAGSVGPLIAARMVQGVGAALSLPAALSILTASFAGRDRTSALAVWGAVGGMASAFGVLAGGLLTEGPGWRWVMFVNPVACALLAGPVLRLLPTARPRLRWRSLDGWGALLVTAGSMLLVYGLVEAPTAGWASARTLAALLVAGGILVAFVAHERRHPRPLADLSLLRLNGLGFADVTQLLAFAGFLSLFFFVTLYLQEVARWSPLDVGLAWLPLCGAIAASATASSALIARLGTRRVMAAGAVVAAGGLAWVSRVPVHGHYGSDLLPGLLVLAFGFGPVFVATTTAANDGVPADRSGLAAALLNASQQVGGALGLAVLTAVATTRSRHALAAGASAGVALTRGFDLALLVGAAFILAAGVVALRATDTRGAASSSGAGAARSPAVS